MCVVEKKERLCKLKEKVLSGRAISEAEAGELIEAPLDELCRAADEIRQAFCGNVFDICSCVNVRGGKCAEDCKFCPQSRYNDKIAVEPHSLIGTEEILQQAEYMAQKGVVRCDLVSSGRRLPKESVRAIAADIQSIRNKIGISVCCSFGLIDDEDCAMLREAGVTRLHNNLESSRTFFETVCTTHSTDDKLATLRAARKAGMTLCSGCLLNLGETMQDRIALAFMEKSMGVTSIPVNLLNPVRDSAYDGQEPMSNEELCRTVAIFRFILPDASIRLAAGRIFLEDYGRRALQSGANAVITGDFLTTGGISIDSDMAMAKELGYEPGLWK